jgi:hypothetical protein
LGRGFDCLSCKEYSFSDQTVLAALERGFHDVQCPVCRENDRIFDRSLRERHKEDDRPDPRPGSALAKAPSYQAPSACYHILHLSDLHFSADGDANVMAQPLLVDLRKFGPIDYLVVSGDLADKADPKGFEHAERFLTKLLTELRLTSERVIMTRRNHDVDEAVDVHDLVPRKRLARTT